MSSGLATRIDPDWSARLTIAGVLGCAALAGLTAIKPAFGVGAAAGVAVLSIAISLHRWLGLGPMWPLVGVALLQPLNGLRPLPFVAVGDVAMIALVGLAAFIVSRAKAIEPLIVMLLGALIVTAGGTIGMAVSEDLSGGASMAKFVLGTPVVVLVVMILNPNYRANLMLLTAYAVGGAISSVVASIEPVDPTFGRSDGWSAHAGHLALSGLLGFFVMLGWLLTTSHVGARIAAGIIAILCLYGVVLSGTRSAVLGLAAGILFVAIAARWRGVAILTGVVAGTILFLKLIVPYLPYRNNIERAFGVGELAGGTQLTNDLHADILRDALRLIGQHPFTGVGFAEGQTAHNMVLQVASMGGLVALIGLIVLWTPVIFLATKRLNEGLSKESAMRICVIAGVVGYFVYAQFQPLIWDRHLWFFISLAVLLQVTKHPAQPESHKIVTRENQP